MEFSLSMTLAPKLQPTSGNSLMNSSPTSISGFNLVELILVVAIAGILTVIAMPSFTGLSESQRVKNAGFELYAMFNIARSEAIKRNSNVTLAPVTSGGVLTSIDITAADGTLLYSKLMPKKVGIKATVPGITYRRTGRITAAGTPTFQIDVENAATPTEHARCITLGLSGTPQTRKGAC